MNLFKRNKQLVSSNQGPAPQNFLADLALATIHDGVIIVDRAGTIQYANPAAALMLGYNSPESIIGFDAGLLFQIESKEGRELAGNENQILGSIRAGQALEGYEVCLISGAAKKRIPISVSLIPVNNPTNSRIITFRNITRELAEEGEQTEFISTASHEMRTPVASIEGYLSLALNPQTATIDERARTYFRTALS